MGGSSPPPPPGYATGNNNLKSALRHLKNCSMEKVLQKIMFFFSRTIVLLGGSSVKK